MNIFLLAIIYLAFVSLGLPDGALGLAWPSMRLDFAQPLESMGILVSLLLWLSALSSIASGNLMRRWGTGVITAASGMLTALALTGFACAPHFIWLVLFTLPLGLGQGAVDAALNNYVANHYSARHMNWLHCCWGVGASLGPLIMTMALAVFQWRWGYAALASLQGLLAGVLCWSVYAGLWRTGEKPPALSPVNKDGTTLPLTSEGHILHQGLYLKQDQAVAVLLFFLYAGVEFSLGLWLNTVLVEGRGVNTALAGLTVTLFYAAIMGGRFLAGLLVTRWGNGRMLRRGLGLAVLGVGLLWAAPALPAAFLSASLPLSMPLTIVGAVLAGLGLAPLYPGLMHETPRRFRSSVCQRLMGWQVGAACLGGSLLTSGLGLLLARWSPEWLFPCTLAMLLCVSAGNAYLVRRQGQTRHDDK